MNELEGTSLRAAVTPDGTPGAVVLWSTGTMPPSKHLRLRFRLRVPTGAKTYAVVGALRVGNHGMEHGLAVDPCPESTNGCFRENQPDGRTPGSGGTRVPIDPGVVHDAEVTLRWSGTEWAGTVSVNGTLLRARPNALPNLTTSNAGTHLVGVGAFYTGRQPGTTEVIVDNVYVTHEP